MTIGPKIAEGPEAELYTWDGDAVLKLYRSGYPGNLTETAALTALQHHQVAPALTGTVEIDGRHGLIMERLHGTDMLSLLQRQPWQVLKLARILATAQHAVNSVPAPADLPDLKQTLATHVHDGVQKPALRDFALGILEQLPTGDRLCHGDLHPGNVLITPGRTSVIDWSAATRGAPAADYARTLFLLRQADPPPGTPMLFRGLMAAGRAAFAHAFSRAYRRSSPTPLTHIRSWTIVHTAARLAMGIEVEQPKLIASLRRSKNMTH